MAIQPADTSRHLMTRPEPGCRSSLRAFERSGLSGGGRWVGDPAWAQRNIGDRNVSMSAQQEVFPDDGSDLSKAKHCDAQAYIQQLLIVAADDARNVLLLATVAIAAVVILAKDLGTAVHDMGKPWSYIAVGAAVCLVLAAALYGYSAKINQRRMDLVRCLASANAAGARELWAGGEAGIAAQSGWLLKIGASLLVIGATCALVVVGVLVG